jgi:hypothetical protein
MSSRRAVGTLFRQSRMAYRSCFRVDRLVQKWWKTGYEMTRVFPEVVK